jgi:hypothetical protein
VLSSSREGRGGRDVVGLSSSSSLSSRISLSCVGDDVEERGGWGDRDDNCGRGGRVVLVVAGGGTSLVVVVVVEPRW